MKSTDRVPTPAEQAEAVARLKEMARAGFPASVEALCAARFPNARGPDGNLLWPPPGHGTAP